MSGKERASCDTKIAVKMPCDLLKFPHKEEGFQLALRAEQLFEFVSGSCNSRWVEIYKNVITDLKRASAPADGEPCPELGKEISKELVKIFNNDHEKTYGISLKQSLSNEREESRKE